MYRQISSDYIHHLVWFFWTGGKKDGCFTRRWKKKKSLLTCSFHHFNLSLTLFNPMHANRLYISSLLPQVKWSLNMVRMPIAWRWMCGPCAASQERVHFCKFPCTQRVKPEWFLNNYFQILRWFLFCWKILCHLVTSVYIFVARYLITWEFRYCLFWRDISSVGTEKVNLIIMQNFTQ